MKYIWLIGLWMCNCLLDIVQLRSGRQLAFAVSKDPHRYGRFLQILRGGIVC